MALFKRTQPTAPAASSFPPPPRVPADFVPRLLADAGFPADKPNLEATTERVAMMFRTKAHQFIGQMGTPAELREFDRKTAQPAGDLASWPQATLDALVAWNPEVSGYIQDLPDKVRRLLLESKAERGGFFAKGPNEPLARMSDF